MDGEKLFLSGLTIVLVTFITAMGMHNYHETKNIAEGIAAGGDPIRVSCAYDPFNYCDILASQQTSTTK